MDLNLLAFPFDATEWEPAYTSGFKTYPAGIYLMAISDMSPQLARNSSENGMLRVEYTIYSEPYQGQKYTEFLNLWHSSDQTREIAMKQLSAICHLVGKLQIQNLSELANLPMMNELDFQEAVPGGFDAMGREVKAQPARNRIIKREAYSDQAAAAAQGHKPMNPPFQPSGNAAQAAAAPPMAQASQQPPQAAQAPATAPAQPQRQTPPPFAARPNGAVQPNGAAGQQTVAAQPQNQAAQPGAVPPWMAQR